LLRRSLSSLTGTSASAHFFVARFLSLPRGVDHDHSVRNGPPTIVSSTTRQAPSACSTPRCPGGLSGATSTGPAGSCTCAGRCARGCSTTQRRRAFGASSRCPRRCSPNSRRGASLAPRLSTISYFRISRGSRSTPRTAPKRVQAGTCRAGLCVVRFHDLRHTCASLFLPVGVGVVAVGRLLGHSSPIVALSVYSHSIRKGRAGVTATLSEFPCSAAGSKPLADGQKPIESAVGSAPKSLERLVGRARIERATNWLKGSPGTHHPDRAEREAPEFQAFRLGLVRLRLADSAQSGSVVVAAR
jgi:Phage integrase family